MTEQQELAKKLEAASWGWFFLWIGISLLWEAGWGVALLGVGVITLAGQAARRHFNLKLEAFWVVVGVLFLLGGLGAHYELELPMGHIVLIVAGLALLISVFTGRRTANQ